MSNQDETRTDDDGLSEELAPESFDELVWYTGSGFLGGLLAAAVLDLFGFQQNPVGQWFVRTLAGEGESIFEGVFAIGRRLRGHAGSMAEAYGWGKLLGMTAPWAVDLVSRLVGVNVYGVEGFYIPYFYAMSDQIGANVAGMIFLRRRERSWFRAVIRYARHPVMLASLGGDPAGARGFAGRAADWLQPDHTGVDGRRDDRFESLLGSAGRRLDRRKAETFIEACTFQVETVKLNGSFSRRPSGPRDAERCSDLPWRQV